jgi:hypothetical protein
MRTTQSTGGNIMREMTVTEMKEVGGGGTRIGTTGSGDGGLHLVGGTGAPPLGGRIDPGGAKDDATPTLV